MNTVNLKLLRPFALCVVALLFAACGQQESATTEEASADAPMSAAKVAVTTSSDEARALYMEGQALSDDLHAVEAQASAIGTKQTLVNIRS